MRRHSQVHKNKYKPYKICVVFSRKYVFSLSASIVFNPGTSCWISLFWGCTERQSLKVSGIWQSILIYTHMYTAFTIQSPKINSTSVHFHLWHVIKIRPQLLPTILRTLNCGVETLFHIKIYSFIFGCQEYWKTTTYTVKPLYSHQIVLS